MLVTCEIKLLFIIEKVDTSNAKYFDVTIMFLDIRNFTKLVDSRAPQEVANFQNIIFLNMIFSENKISVSDGSLRIPPLSHIIYSPNGVNQKTGSRRDTKVKEVPTIGHLILIKLNKYYTTMMCIC